MSFKRTVLLKVFDLFNQKSILLYFYTVKNNNFRPDNLHNIGYIFIFHSSDSYLKSQIKINILISKNWHPNLDAHLLWDILTSNSVWMKKSFFPINLLDSDPFGHRFQSSPKQYFVQGRKKIKWISRLISNEINM